jgi:hypothetical protein
MLFEIPSGPPRLPLVTAALTYDIRDDGLLHCRFCEGLLVFGPPFANLYCSTCEVTHGDPAEALKEFLIGRLGFCACGAPEEALGLLYKVLAALAARPLGEAPEETRQAWDADYLSLLNVGERPDLAYAYLYWLDGVGLVEHGWNILNCWLTPEGERLLAVLEGYDLDTVFE